MNLTEEQKQKVSSWIKEGIKLSEIQQRLEKEIGLRLTYLETRLLVDDLKLVPKDQEAAPATLPTVAPGAATKPAGPGKGPAQPAAPEPDTIPKGGSVSVTVDTVARPGALVSGRVTFSDGQKAEWVLDQLGRLGLIPQQQGYRPPAADMQSFQIQLENELQKSGF